MRASACPLARVSRAWRTFPSRSDACAATGARAYYGPFGAIDDPVGCEDQFRNSFLLGCVGAWSLHPSQIDIAKRVFSPDAEEVAWARRVVEAMPDGSGTAMIDGKMQDDATFKQCQVMLETARQIAERDEAYRDLYGF